jgi:hypothetical protein
MHPVGAGAELPGAAPAPRRPRLVESSRVESPTWRAPGYVELSSCRSVESGRAAGSQVECVRYLLHVLGLDTVTEWGLGCLYVPT